MRALVLLGLGVALWGCPGDLEKQSEIRKLRVLGVRAEPPELLLTADGGVPATTLTALAVEPSGAPIEVKFALCTRLGDAPPGGLGCPGADGIDLAAAGTPQSARLDLSDPRILAFASQAQLDGGSFDAGGIAVALSQGVPLLVGFEASAPPAQRLEGFQTLILRTPERGPANVNPELTDLQLATARSDFDVDPAVSLDATSTVAVNARTHLTPVTAPKDDASEKYLFSFFATGGEISSLHSTDKTSSGDPAPTWVQWTAPAEPQTVRFWVVVRDGRGGTAWIERSVAVK